MATTTTTYSTFGDLGGTAYGRRRMQPERIMPKSQQVAKIRQFLSNRGADIDVLDLVGDWVDPTVIYEVNKAEIVQRVGFATTQKPPTNKELAEMQCTSLHNECAKDGLETCQVACEECGDTPSCKKATTIEGEVKKHGRELTHFERAEIEREKEAKRPLKRAKFTKGQAIKCREGYSCGFSGVSRITEVKQYPDYVLYGIEGKEQGFVDEEWVEGTKKPKKTEKEKLKLLISKFEGYRRESIPLTAGGVRSSAYDAGLKRFSEKENAVREKIKKGTTQILGYEPLDPLAEAYKYTGLTPSKGLGIALPEQKATKPKKKSMYVTFKGVKKHRMRCPICGRAAPEDFCMVHGDVDALDLEVSKKAQEMVMENLEFHKEWEAAHPKEAEAGRKAEEELKKRVEPYMTVEEKAAEKGKAVVVKELTKTTKKEVAKVTKPPKPISTSKHQKAEIHQKVLTKGQLKEIRNFGEAFIQIGGSRERVIASNFNPRSNTVYWWKQAGEIHLKTVREVDEVDVNPTSQLQSPSKYYLIKHSDGTYHKAKAIKPIKIESLKHRYVGCTVYELKQNRWVKLFGSGAKQSKKDKIIGAMDGSGKYVRDIAGDADASRSYAYQVLKKSRKAKVAGRRDLRYKK